MSPPPFEILSPLEIKAGIVVTSPHSGAYLPDFFLKQTDLSINELRASEDSFVDEFVKFAPIHGYTSILANYSRSYIDLNRDFKVFDSKIIEGIMPNASCIYTNNGFGIIPRISGGNLKIYKEKIPLNDAKNRLETIYNPYHAAVKAHLDDCLSKFEKAMLLDIHSMPKKALGDNDCDIVIGDRFGTSCDDAITKYLRDFFSYRGLKVQLNSPYAGGYTTRQYGKPKSRIHAVQIEVNRSLYMNEYLFIRSDNFKEIQKLFDTLFGEISTIYAYIK